MINIAIAGTGYVGLSLAVLLSRQNIVTAVDVVEEKIRLINNGVSPIVDREIEEYLSKDSLNLSATLDGKAAYGVAEIVIIATPTNYDEQRNEFDTSHVEEVIELVLEVNPDALMVVKSTIPVGYTDEISKRYPEGNFLFSPEFLREGHALYDNLHPSRIIVGIPQEHYENEKDIDEANKFAEILKQATLDLETPVLIMAAREAEAVKLFANTYLAARVAYFNELDTYASICGMDAKKIIEGVVLDPRIGAYYCNPSFGYGGYCLPKDTKQLLAGFEDIPQRMITAVVDSNKIRKKFVSDEIIRQIKQSELAIENATVGAYRLIMKSGSDNYRASAIQDIICELRDQGLNVVVYEPTFSEDDFNGFEVEKQLDSFINRSDVILANRMDDCLRPVGKKVYTRDCFYKD